MVPMTLLKTDLTLFKHMGWREHLCTLNQQIGKNHTLRANQRFVFGRTCYYIGNINTLARITHRELKTARDMV